jgi:addiction module RelE/StbE family toxin
MWRIEEHSRLEKQLDSTPLEIQKRYEKWKDIAIISGPPGPRAIRRFRDDALSGQWKEYRSLRLSLKHRVIYRVVASQVVFQVVEVTPHDYRRR